MKYPLIFLMLSSSVMSFSCLNVTNKPLEQAEKSYYTFDIKATLTEENAEKFKLYMDSLSASRISVKDGILKFELPVQCDTPPYLQFY